MRLYKSGSRYLEFGDIRLPEHFWSKCIPEPNSGCWLWIASKTTNGYGKFSIARRLHPAHRVAWEALNGEVPCGLEMDHRCRTRCCVNPAHLEAVKHKTNVRRGTAGDAQAARSHCPSGHPYDATNTSIHLRRGMMTYRRCRQCDRKHWREYKRRIRAK